MKSTWKALAGFAVAAALVIAPLSAAGASANEGAQGEGSSAPTSFVVALWKSVTPGKAWPQVLVASTKTSAPSLSALDSRATEPCTIYQADIYADDAKTASLIAGGHLASSGSSAESWPGGTYRSSFTKGWVTDCTTTEVTPPVPTWNDPCGPDNGYWTTPATTGVVWQTGPYKGYIVAYATPATGYSFPKDAVTKWYMKDAGGECGTNYPVPALFSAEPAPPTCGTAGTFDTGFLGAPVYTNATGTWYNFQNVYVAVNRNTPGQVTLTIQAKPGFVLTGLSSAWSVSAGGTHAVRTIQLGAALPTQTTDPAAPCFLATVTLGTPTVDDQCFTANDTAVLPADTEGVTYAWAAEDSYDVIATVAPGNVVAEPLPTGWVSNGDGTYTYTWSPVFTDVDCPLAPGVIASQCVGSIPYLGYSLTLPEGYVPTSETPLKITFVNPTDPSQNYVVSNLPLTGKLLWPGASATEPLQWPGWELKPDGTYVKTTGNYDWTRAAAGVTVLFEVNPSYQMTVTYPPESSTCANPPSSSLAATGGSDMVPWGLAALGILTVGLSLAITRRRLANR